MKTLLNFLIGYLAIAILISILSGDIATGFSFTIIIGIYMLPSWLASSRGHPNQGSISTLNLFLGWTFIGWVAALVWANSYIDKDKKQKTAIDYLKE